MKSLNTVGLLHSLDLWFEVSRRLQGRTVMRGNFLHSSVVVSVGTRSSSHGVKKGHSMYKIQCDTDTLFILPTCARYKLQHPTPEPWDTETLTGSNCGVTTCSLFPPEKCWREKWDHVKIAAFCRAGKQENCQGEGSIPLNCVVIALCFWYHSLSQAVGIALLPILYLLIHNWKLLAFYFS